MQSERFSRITIDDAQCGGRPCIRGMRIRIVVSRGQENGVNIMPYDLEFGNQALL